jgi:hypothetical protein
MLKSFILLAMQEERKAWREEFRAETEAIRARTKAMQDERMKANIDACQETIQVTIYFPL